MSVQDDQIVSKIVGELEAAWNRADGVAFGRWFTGDADFVNVRGEHARGREAIATGHQGIFDSIYKGSVVRYEPVAVRALSPGILLAHVTGRLSVPSGPLAGEHQSLLTAVLVEDQNEWRIAAFHNTLVAPLRH